MRGCAVIFSVGAVAVLAALSMVPVAYGQANEMPPGVLPADEAAAGWINLFDKETTYGWTAFGDAQWTVVDGVLTCATGSGGLLATSTQFADFEMDVTIRVSGERSTSGLQVRSPLQGHYSENGATVIPLSEPAEGDHNWHSIHVVASGNNVTATLDDQPVELGRRSRSTGYIAIQYHGHGGKVEVSEAKVKPTNLEPIFNGKDLTGWNVIPGHDSEFSVVDGALNIKKGNGQIETANLYKDFVLQLDIFSNGDHLNSGVFYRSPAGVFWKGYEIQVRNQWNEDRRNPVDYGTGGNYGNQPTRMVVSTDREWWHETIIAEGNHTAVWVNGYQTSDFTDTRPVSDNAQGKEGYVPGPGTINLQGHDPTTDLSFKNIRIEEYPQHGPRMGVRPEGPRGGEGAQSERGREHSGRRGQGQ